MTEPVAPAPQRRKQRSARHQFASTILVLEAFVVVFLTLVGYGLRAAPPSVVWLVGGSVALACVLVAGLLRWPAGYVAGSVVQVAVVGLGWFFSVAAMYVVGGVFVLLWFWGLRLGARIDRERAERAEAEAAYEQAQASGEAPDGR